jgi:hypothetical protein
MHLNILGWLGLADRAEITLGPKKARTAINPEPNDLSAQHLLVSFRLTERAPAPKQQIHF